MATTSALPAETPETPYWNGKPLPKHHYWKGKPLPPIFYEDPEPAEDDDMLQADTISRVTPALRRRFQDFLVMDGGFIMPDPENGNDRFATDCYISFDLSRQDLEDLDIPNYWTWVVGNIPQFALEVASKSTAERDRNFKRDLYLRLGFREYLMLDPTGEFHGKPITALHRVGDRFEEYPVHETADGSLWTHSELLDLDFWWIKGAPEWDPFDVRDPATGKSICVGEMYEAERAARLAEREARIAAEERERELLRQIERLQERGRS